MANQYINKIIYGDQTLIDLTSDTVASNKMLSGITAHDKTGATVTGSIPSLGANTYTPTTTAQTINANQYLSGIQTISGDINFVADNLKAGTTIFGVAGTFTGDANAASSEILSGKTAYVNGLKITGTMINNGSVTGTISTKSQEYTIPIGFHDGSGKVSISSTEQAKIIAGNIKAGITILGVVGTYSGEAITALPLSVTPYITAKNYNPPSGADYISEVSVSAIAYSEVDNSAGGKTVTIGTIDPDA